MDTNVTNPALETTTPPTVAASQGSPGAEAQGVKGLIDAFESAAKADVKSPDSPSTVLQAEPSQPSGAGDVKVGGGKVGSETSRDGNEGDSQTSTAAQDSQSSDVPSDRAVEEIEMSTFQNSSQSSADDKKTAASGDISGIDKGKISSSTPCLLPSAKAANPDKKPPIIQKATSSPALPVIKITQVDENEEIVIMESAEPTESGTESGKEPTEEGPADDASARAAPNDETGGLDDEVSTSVDSTTSPVGHSEDQTSAILEDETSTAVDSTTSHAGRSEEQSATGLDSTVSHAENEARAEERSEAAQDEERKTFFYISSSELPPEMRSHPPSRTRDFSYSGMLCDYSSEDTYSYNQESLEEPRCLGRKSLHVGIVMLSVLVAVFGLAFYKMAHEGKMAQSYETAGLSIAAIAFVVGGFSILYISFLMCFPVIPSIQYEMIGDVDTVTSVERILCPQRGSAEGEDEAVAAAPAQIRDGESSSGSEENDQDPLALLDRAHKLRTEVTGLIHTLINAISGEAKTESAEEQLVGSETEKDSSSETTESVASQETVGESAEIPADSSSSSSASTTPSKKDD